MENKIATIEIKGIQRNVPGQGVADGACDEIINLRHKDNAWRPVGKKAQVGRLPVEIAYDANTWLVRFMYRHPALPAHLFIAILQEKTVGTANMVCVVDIDTISAPVAQVIKTGITLADFKQFTHLGNVLVMGMKEDRFVFLWDNDTSQYAELTEPKMPKIFFSREIEYTASVSVPSRLELSEALGDYYELLSEKAEQGILTGHMMFVVVFRLFDGSVIKHTNPYYIPLSYIEGTGGETKPLVHTLDGYTFQRIVFSKNITMNYLISSADAANLNKYKGVITEVQIYAAWVQNHFSLTDDEEKDYEEQSTDIIRPIRYNEQLSSFTDSPAFHRVKILSLEDFIKTPDAYNQVSEFDFEALETKPQLSVDDFTHHKTWGDVSTIYNNRIHYSRITQVFGNPTGMMIDFPPDIELTHTQVGLSGRLYKYMDDLSVAATSHHFYLESTIKTQVGSYIVRERFYPTMFAKVMGDFSIQRFIFIEPYLSYPDIRAEKLRVLASGDEGATLHELKSFDLTPHPYLNVSYYAKTDLTSMWLLDNTEMYIRYDNMNNLTTSVVKNLLHEPDRVQLTGQMNPFVHPASNSYRFDNTVVKAIGSVAEAISEGQFGQFPLYVFTDSGIFLMQQGQGQVMYSNQLPLNKETVTSDNILSVSGGVVFIAKDGLKLITSQRQVVDIGKIVKGSPDLLLVDDPDFVNSAGSMLTVLSQTNFVNYLQASGTAFAYDHVHNEIIVSNNLYTYSYIYMLEAGAWYKVSNSFELAVFNYPDWLVLKDGVLNNQSVEDTTVKSPVLLVTRPVKLNSFAYKKIEKIIARMRLLTTLNNLSLLCYVSDDLQTWRFTGGSKVDVNSVMNVIVRRFNTSARYFIFTLSYTSDETGYVSHFEVLHNERFATTLR